jgi:SNF2 family DNA or RNA helicase
LIYPTRHAEALGAVGFARRLPSGQVVVPADLPALATLAFARVPVPSPLDLAGYTWPIRLGRQPMAHQKVMAAFMALHARCFNLSELGTAKTLAALWAADFLMSEGVIRRALIIAPLSTLHDTWGEEIFRSFIGRRTFEVVYGPREKRLQTLAKDVDFFITNHDGLTLGSKKIVKDNKHGLFLGPIAAEVRAREDIGLVIADEASAYKHRTSVRWKVLRDVIASKPAAWLMTGTPMAQHPTDAYALIKLVRPDYRERFQDFQQRTMYQTSHYSWVPRRGVERIVYAELQPAVRFARKDCIDLPECLVPPPRHVELSPEQLKAYNDFRKEAVTTLANGAKVTAVHEAALRQKYIQVACGVIYDGAKRPHLLNPTARLQELEGIVAEAPAKVLIFCPLTSAVDMVQSHLKKCSSVASVTGETSAGDRREIFTAFRNSEALQVIVATPGTMAHGLTLTEAATVVWYAPVDSAELYEQANGRINRPGQKNKMVIVRLSSTPLEREIYRRLEAKIALQGAMLSLMEKNHG